MKPEISIIVPIYNVEKYLPRCIESILAQTFTNFELILVNDGSEDDSGEVCDRYAKEDKRIKVIHKKNGGVSSARNAGLKNSIGNYIGFVDPDDYIKKDMYEKMYNIAKKENSDMVQCNFYWEYPDLNKKKIADMPKYSGKKEMFEKTRVEAWNKLIKRDILEESKVEFPKGLRYEDVEFTYKLVPYINKVSFIEEPLVHYIQRGNSISNSQNERTKEIFDILDNVIKYYKEKNLYEEYKEVIEYIYVKTVFCRSLLRMVKISDENVQAKLLEKTWENVNSKFPNWKKNEILKKRKTIKDLYLKSINKFTYKIYCTILSLI